jgi:large subunit ribosomal protein L31
LKRITLSLPLFFGKRSIKNNFVMRKDIHPNYREVVFFDTSTETQFITRSTINTPDTIEVEGKTYPLVKIEVSSDSHPFYTGKKMLVDTAGRVEKFNRRYVKK